MNRYVRMPNPEIARGSMSISAVQPEHIEPIRQWRNAQMDVLRQSTLITPEAQRSYFDTVVWPDLDSAEPRQLLVSIFHDHQLIGYGGLVHISWLDLRGEVSFLVNPELANDIQTYDAIFSGFLDLIQILAFTDLGLKRIFTETYAHRTAHIGILERCGFLPEGRLRGHVRIDNRPVDSLFHGITTYDER